jgi:hypothetical protein
MNDIVIRGSDRPDLPFESQVSLLALLQGLSPQVIPGDPKHITGAMPGMFAGRLDGEQVLFTEFVFLLIGFLLTHPEFAPNQKAPIHDHGERLPREAVFHYAHEGYPRSGHYIPNGNEVVPTINAFMLVDYGGRWVPGAYRFMHSAYLIGRQFGSRAAGYKAVVEGEKVQGCTVPKHKMTSYLDTRNGKSFYLPKPVFLGKVGEPGYPMPEYRFVDELRRAFKQGDDWAALEPPEPPALPEAKTVVIEADPPPCNDDPNMVPEGVVVDAEEIV